MRDPGWPRPQRLLHWATAALVLAAFGIAWPMVAVPFRALLLKFTLYQAHKSLGLMVLAAAALRLACRAWRARPPWDAALSRAEIRAARLGHLGLYALLLAVPLLGYVTAASAPLRIPTVFLGAVNVPHLIAPDPAVFAAARLAHRVLAILLVLLACGHAAIALRHHVRGRPVLRRMWSGRS